tara:strand:+ start:7895 stop:8095 length:201 start_codon:yes stop_codon:yes gene_type:complete
MPKKSQTKYMKAKHNFVKQMNTNTPTYKQGLQHDVEKAQKRDKIKPKEIFETKGNKTKQKKKYGKK